MQSEKFGDDWVDSDRMVPIVNPNTFDPIRMARPLSKDRQELKNQRTQNGASQRKEDSVDGVIMSRYGTNFNANTAKYNTFEDNSSYRKSKRGRNDDDDDTVDLRSKRHPDRYTEIRSDRHYNERDRHSNRTGDRSKRSNFDDKELEERRKRMLDNGHWREKQRTIDVEMYVEANLKEDQEIQRNLNRIHAIKNC